LTVGPVFCEKFREKESVSISGKHDRASPKTSNSIKLFAHYPTSWVQGIFVSLGEENFDTGGSRRTEL